MNTKALVIIPSLMVKYSFSAPLCWMFAGMKDHVEGVYSFELTESKARDHKVFVVELMWFIQLYEFIEICRFLKRHNPHCKILFGGLFSQLKYGELFRMAPVDYFIRGDNELPIRAFLSGQDPRTIPNMVGRDFENPHGYFFSESDYKSLEFDLDWFPSYQNYWHAPEGLDPNRHYDFPFPPHGRYHLPVLITARGGCPAQHAECDSCIAHQPGLMKRLYGRSVVRMDNDTLIHLLHKVERKFNHASIIQINNQHYDFSGEQFDLDCTIEIDWLASVESVHRMLPAFRRSHWHLSLYSQGLADSQKRTQKEIHRFIEMESENHQIQFWGSRADLNAMEIPEKNALYFGDFFPETFHFKYYNQMENALFASKRWYMFTRQTNLYPENAVAKHLAEADAWLERMDKACQSGKVPRENFLAVL